MSLLSPKQKYTILPPQQRQQVIRSNILTMTYEQLAKKCHCAKRTIIRDVDKWKQEGGFEQFLMDEFFRSYPDIKEKFPERAFDRLCYLLGKTMTRKIDVKKEVKTEHKTDVSVLIEKYETVINRAANRNIQKDSS